MLGRPVPPRPGAEPRHPRGVPGARLPDPVDPLDPQGRGLPRPLLRGGPRSRARSRRRSRSTTSGRRTTRPTGAEGVGGEVRGPPPERGGARPSSFKCGHDAPTYGIIDSIIAAAQTPYAALHDIDANKPGGSIKIRVKTYAHSLKLHEERLEDVADAKQELGLPHRAEAARAAASSRQAQLAERAAGRSGHRPADRRDASSKVRAYEQARAAKTDAEKAAERASMRSKKRGHRAAGDQAQRVRCHRQDLTEDGDAMGTARHDMEPDFACRCWARSASERRRRSRPSCKQFEAEERARLGLDGRDRALGRRHVDPQFTKSERARDHAARSAA